MVIFYKNPQKRRQIDLTAPAKVVVVITFYTATTKVVVVCYWVQEKVEKFSFSLRGY